MSADVQNTPHVIAVMRKIEGIDGSFMAMLPGTSVKSPDSYLSPDQNEDNGRGREQTICHASESARPVCPLPNKEAP